MTISYPLALPTHTGFAQIELRATNAVAYARSPFTFAGQAFAYPGQMWQADITLPPMKRADAEQWVAWLLSLRGQLGTFLLGDPNGAAPRGTALANRVNLLNYTEQLDNAYWGKNGVTITANATTSPDGKVTADQAVEALTTTHQISFTAGVTAGSSYTVSVYIKPNGRPRARIVTTGTSFGSQTAIFDVTAGTFVSGSGRISNEGNGWYRCSQTFTASATETLTCRFRPDNGTIDSYTGDGVSGFFLWGAQFETGSTATTYQPIFNNYGPYVNGANQTGGSLIIDGASPDETGYLLAGDYIQLGSNGSSTLHKVLTNVDTDSSGNATLDIWPHIRTAPADNAAVTVSNAKGLFRLSSNEQAWSVNEAAIYGITFGAMEAV